MREYLWVIFLLLKWRPVFGSNNEYNTKYVANSNGYGDIDGRYKIGNQGNLGDILLNKKFDYAVDYEKDRGMFERSNYKFGFDDGHPDIHGNIERPCQSYDTFCIRKFFAEHSRCKISGRKLPDPFFRTQTTLNYPSANMSVTIDNMLYSGLSKGHVEEFYINRVTDNLVIVFYFDDVTLVSNNSVTLKYYLRGREPVVTRDFGSVSFLQLEITLIIPRLNDLMLDRAEVFTYGNNPILPYFIGPQLGVSSDPEVEAMFVYFASVGVRLELIEELTTEGVFFGTNYLQHNICDFGLKVL